MAQSENIKQLASALSKAQGDMKAAIKSNDNPFFKSKYADLSSVWDACRDALSSNGLSVTQIPRMAKIDNESKFCLETTLLHLSGEWMSGLYPINPVKNDPQGTGSAITYARRYALAAMVGVAQADDDGKGASKSPTIKKSIVESVVSQTLEALENKDKLALDEIWSEFGIEEQAALWKSFNSKERSAIKALKKGE